MGDAADVRVGILLADAMEASCWVSREAIFDHIKDRMLAGENERRRNAARSKGASDGSQLDRFRPGADDQPDIRDAQYSP